MVAAMENTRKAAMLLLTLDPSMAAELLKAAEPHTITAIAAELAYLDSMGVSREKVDEAPVREFCTLLRRGKKTRRTGEAFLREMLENAVGSQDSTRLLDEVEQMVLMRDPFRAIRKADAKSIAKALQGESSQVGAMVLAELPASKSAELLELLDEDIRGEAITGMASGQDVAPEAKLRVASVIENRLFGRAEGGEAEAQTMPATEEPEDRSAKLRNVAVLLRGLKVDFREELMEGLVEQEPETAKAVRDQMVIWEDIGLVADRSLQEALRTVDSRRLALALVGADEHAANRVRENISERANTMLDEESSLLSDPKEEEISDARETILGSLREMNQEGELKFIDPEEKE